MSFTLLRELHNAAWKTPERTDICAIVVTGTEGYFSAGMDLSDPEFNTLSNTSLSEKRSLLSYAPRMCRAWEELDQVTIAAIEGFCLGGGVFPRLLHGLPHNGRIILHPGPGDRVRDEHELGHPASSRAPDRPGQDESAHHPGGEGGRP